jgi:hypothetical protein
MEKQMDEEQFVRGMRCMKSEMSVAFFGFDETFQYKEVRWPYRLVQPYAITLDLRFFHAFDKNRRRSGRWKHEFITIWPGSGDYSILEIENHYGWNGASGPAIDTRETMRASLVHDALYQLIREGYLPKEMRKRADKEFYKICREDGMSWFRAQYFYRAVRMFGGAHV